MPTVKILTLALFKSFLLFISACLITRRIVSARSVVSSIHTVLITKTKAK